MIPKWESSELNPDLLVYENERDNLLFYASKLSDDLEGSNYYVRLLAIGQEFNGFYRDLDEAVKDLVEKLDYTLDAIWEHNAYVDR